MDKFKIIKPSVNPATLQDGRGVVETYIPPVPIVEFNRIVIKPGKTRGGHFHLHFVEYLLVMSGHGIMYVKDMDSDFTDTVVMSPGVCTMALPRLLHRVYAVDDLVMVAMLTRQWDHSDPPIVQVEDF